MSLKSRGRSPGGNGGHPRQAEAAAGRGASLGAGHAGKWEEEHHEDHFNDS